MVAIFSFLVIMNTRGLRGGHFTHLYLLFCCGSLILSMLLGKGPVLWRCSQFSLPYFANYSAILLFNYLLSVLGYLSPLEKESKNCFNFIYVGILLEISFVRRYICSIDLCADL